MTTALAPMHRLWRRASDTGDPVPLWWTLPAVALTAAGVVAGLLRRQDPATIPSALWLIGWGVLLAAADLDVMRLPDRLLRPATAGQGLILALTAAATGSAGRLLWALLAMVLLPGLLYVWGVLLVGTTGLGDVKLLILTGLSTGWLGVGAALRGLAAGILVGGLVATGIWLHRRRRHDPRRTFPYGPWLLVGAVIAYIPF